jgi:hypothetical protein
MKRMILILTSLMCFALGGDSLRAVLSYSDTNGITPGAGGPAPTGLWGSDPLDNPFWSYDSSGSILTGPWVAGDTAVFSAGAPASPVLCEWRRPVPAA